MKEAGGTTPYQIQRIEVRGSSRISIKVRKFRDAIGVGDPYAEYPLLRAKIWSQELDAQVRTVNVEEVRCHAAVWNILDTLCVVVVLDRVSFDSRSSLSEIELI